MSLQIWPTSTLKNPIVYPQAKGLQGWTPVWIKGHPLGGHSGGCRGYHILKDHQADGLYGFQID